jgi:transcriptional regulator with XRE-family HTH domain
MASTSPFGEHLKREREMRGVSLEEVSSATRISTKFLVAIENGQWNQLPGGAFNRGFIRSTSRYLGLDEDGMVAEYSLETKNNGTAYAPPRVPGKLPRDWKGILAGAGLIILLVAGGWLAASKVAARLRLRTPAAHTADTAAKSGGTPSPVHLQASPLELVIHASVPTELRVVADGEAVFEGQIQPNDQKSFGARDGFQISLSDTAAVRLELNGQLLPKMGSARQSGRITLTAKDIKSSAGGVH